MTNYRADSRGFERSTGPASPSGIPSAPSQRVSGLQNLNVALLIDFDNVILGVEDPGFDIELVVDALRERGIIVLGRAYGDWYRHNRHRRKLMEQGIELVETPVFGPLIKNSADIRIVLDAFEIAMTQHHIDAFCLVSGDSDFLPLIKKLQFLGKHVIVIAGNKFTSDLVRRNCNEFVSYENLYAESFGVEDATTLDGAFGLLQRALLTLSERGMEARSSAVKQMMVQLNAAFSERNFGYAQFRTFLERANRAGIIKLGARTNSSGEYVVNLPDEAATAGGTSQNGARNNVQNGIAPVSSTLERAPETVRETPISSEDADGVAAHGDVTNGDAATAGRRRRRRRKSANGDAETLEVAADAIAGEEVSVQEDSAAAVEVAPLDLETSDVALENAMSAAPVALAPTMGGGTNLLLGRNVRRGRLKFSAKQGLAAVVAPDVDTTRDPVDVGLETREAVLAETSEPAPDNASNADAITLTLDAAPPVDEQQRAPGEETAGESASPAVVLASEETLPQIALAADAPSDNATSDDANSDADAKPKRTRRGGTRRRKSTTDATAEAATAEAATADATSTDAPDAATPDAATPDAATPDATTAVAERSLPGTAPVDENEAARNEADAQQMGVSIPGATYDIAQSDDTPSPDSAPVDMAAPSVSTPGDPSDDPSLEQPLIASEADAGAVAAVDQAMGELASGAAPDDAKPKRARRGSTRRRKTGTASAEDGSEADASNGMGSGGESSGSQSASGSSASSAGGEG